MQGSEAYDPVARLGAGMTITASEGPDAPGGYTELGSYAIALNDVVFYATLSWKDLEMASNLVLNSGSILPLSSRIEGMVCSANLSTRFSSS